MGTYGRNDDRRPLREFDGPLEGGRFRAGNDVPLHRREPAHLSESSPRPIEGPVRRREHGDPNRAGERWRSSASAS